MTIWVSPVPPRDDFDDLIEDEFIDGKTIYGPWAMMTPKSFRHHSIGRLGTGLGQRYEKQDVDGVFKKVDG